MRNIRPTCFLLLGLLLPAAACMVAGDTTQPELEEEYATTPSGEPIARWNQNGFTALTRGPDARFQIRGMAMMHIAMHDAANLVRARYDGYAVNPTTDDSGADPSLAAAAAAHDVLVALRPDLRSTIDGWLQTDLALVTNAKMRTRSLQVGATAAQAILALRTGDSCCSDPPFAPGSAPGDYRFTPPFTFVYGSGWGAMRPFSLSSGDQFRPAGPPDLSTAEWAAEYNEVQAYGSATSTVRTSQQTFVARFWIDGSAEIFCRMARNLIRERKADLWDSARALALAFIAGNDAAISVWDAKYDYAFWRPITAIRAGDSDGNDATVADPAWSPLATTPPHPEYSSAHSATCAAAAVALGEVFGDVPVHATSSIVPGEVSWPSLTASADECAESRILVGYHFRSSIEHGLAQGYDVGQWVLDHTGLDRL